MSWCDGLPDITAELPCGDEVHRVMWSRGRLKVLDHDVAGEEALAALGGDRCPCLEVFDTWRAVLEGERPPGALPPGLIDVGTLARLARAERSGDDDRLFVVRSRLRDRVADALQASLRWTAAGRAPIRVNLQCRVLAMDESPVLDVTALPREVTVKLGLPASWLVTVAGPGFSSVEGYLVLGVLEPGERPGLLGLSWELGPARVLRPKVASFYASTSESGEWQVAEEPGPPTGRAWWSLRSWSR